MKDCFLMNTLLCYNEKVMNPLSVYQLPVKGLLI